MGVVGVKRANNCCLCKNRRCFVSVNEIADFFHQKVAIRFDEENCDQSNDGEMGKEKEETKLRLKFAVHSLCFHAVEK